MRFFKPIVLAIVGLLASAGLAQIPVPQINLTGNIGCQGFPCVNTGTLIMASDANRTLTAQETSAMSIKVTSSVSLTTTRNLIWPAGKFPVDVENATTGGQSIQVIGTSGTGITIANGQTVRVWNDGTNFVQVGSAGGSFTAAGDLSGSSSSQTVVGLKGTLFCTGFTPTNGQAVTLTTSSSPNPCWTAITPSGSGGTPGGGHYAVQFNDPVGTFAGGAIVTDSTNDLSGVLKYSGQLGSFVHTFSNWSGTGEENQFDNISSWTGPGANYGNIFGWRTQHGFSTVDQSFSSGIHQSGLTVQNCYATGDCAGSYSYVNCIAGWTDLSGEGCTAGTHQVIQVPGYFIGNVVSGGSGATNPVLSQVGGPATVFDGGILLDITTGTTTGSFNGNGSTPVGSTGLHSIPVTGITLPLTVSLATTGASVTKTPGTNSSQTQSVTFTGTHQSIGGFTSATFTTSLPLCVIGPNYIETAQVTGVGTFGATQTVTALVRNPNSTGIVLTQGGLCGKYISVDADVTVMGQYMPYYALGSLTGADLIYAVQGGGSTLNGLLPANDQGAPETTTSAFTLACGAEVTNNPNGSFNTPQVEYNNCAWNPSDLVIGAQWSTMEWSGDFTVCTIFTRSGNNNSCNQILMAGTGISGSAAGFAMVNANAPSTYIFGNGSSLLRAPTGFSISGPYGNIFDIRNGPSIDAFSGNAIINVGATANNDATSFSLFELPLCTPTCNQHQVSMTFNPATGLISTSHGFATNSFALNSGTALTDNQGTGAKVQHSTGTVTTGHQAVFDASGNTIDGGAPGSVAFSAITSGTNTTGLVMGSGGVLSYSGTGLINANELFAVPFCTGYTPTNGQFIQLTTASSPNPCYTASTPSGSGSVGSGTIDGAAYYTGTTTTGSTTAPTTTGHTFMLAWQPSGSAIAPAPLDVATYLASPPAIGGSTANTGAFTTLSATLANTIINLGATIQGTTNLTATNINNYPSPTFELDGSIWNGGTALQDPWRIQTTVASGTNPATTLSLNHPSGSSGVAKVAVPNLAVLSVTGSTQCAQFDTSGNIAGTGSACGGSSSISGLTAGFIPKAGSATTITANSALDDGITTASTITSTETIAAPGFKATGTVPGFFSWDAGTGSIPTLDANSAGFAAPVTGGTSYLFKFPATITAGILHAAAPGTGDGVNESALTSSAVSLTGDVSGILPVVNGGSGTSTPAIVAGTNITVSGTWPNQTINSTGGGGTTTNPLTMNNSGSGAASGTTFDGSAARTISYNTIGAQQALTLTTTGTSGAATLSSGTLNIPQYAGGSGGGGIDGWSGTPLTFISSTTQYAPATGGGLTSATETDVQNAAPAAFTASGLKVKLNAALGAGATLQVTLRDATTGTTLTCTTASGGTTCSDTTHSVNVALGDLIDWQLVSSGTVTAGVPQIVISYAVGTSGVGTTSFASGNLSPLFTTSVATSTTTPVQSFTASTFAAHTFYGNNTASTATPGAQLIGVSDTGPNAYITGAGSVNVMTATFSPAATALTAGLYFWVVPNLANTTTTPTLNVNGLGAVTIKKSVAGVISALAANDYVTTVAAHFLYDGTQMLLLNPQTVTSSSGSILLWSGRQAWAAANFPVSTTQFYASNSESTSEAGSAAPIAVVITTGCTAVISTIATTTGQSLTLQFHKGTYSGGVLSFANVGSSFTLTTGTTPQSQNYTVTGTWAVGDTIDIGVTMGASTTFGNNQIINPPVVCQ